MNLFFDPKPERTQAWSNGGGTQSTAIAALIVRGRLPKPDIAVMVNTERENGNTFPYFHQYVRPALADVGVEVCIVNKSEFATVDLTSKNGKHLLIPAFTTQSGKIGKLSNFCSGEWKRDVIARWLREQGVKQCDQWIGFSLDEMRRVKEDRRQWARSLYPLIELRMNRAACVRVVKEMGWPDPPRSSCWMCPNKLREEWIEMKRDRPEDFVKAVEFDREIRKTDPHVWLHESGIPLDEVEFDLWESSLMSEPGCNSGMCFV